jgi:hypothetical protein
VIGDRGVVRLLQVLDQDVEPGDVRGGCRAFFRGPRGCEVLSVVLDLVHVLERQLVRLAPATEQLPVRSGFLV